MGGKEEEGKRGRKGIRWMCRRGRLAWRMMGDTITDTVLIY